MRRSSLLGYSLTALLTAVIAYVVARQIVVMAIPPGPSPRALRLREPSTVVIDVQPDSRLSGVVFELDGKAQPAGSPARSRIVITGPTTRSEPVSTGIAYVLLLDQAAHLDLLNAQLKKEDPLEVSLMFEFEKVDPNSLFAKLKEARRADSKAKFRVTVECWYQQNGRYLLSTEQDDYVIRDY